MTSVHDVKGVLRFCYASDKRVCCLLILLLIFNINFFILFTFYFTDTPDFAENTASVSHSQYLRKSPYDHQNISAQVGVKYIPSDGVGEGEGGKSSTLPSFSHDQSEFIMSAIIERQAGVDQLYLTVFALNRMLLSEGRSSWGPNRVSKEARKEWATAEQITRRIYYQKNGTRDKISNIYCQITNAVASVPYLMQGRFVPNALSIDESFNSKIDIFRCDMRNIMHSHSLLAASNQSINVQLLRHERSGGWSSLLNFSVPWRSRCAGYMQQPEAGSPLVRSHYARDASRPLPLSAEGKLSSSKWDPWERYDDSSSPGGANYSSSSVSSPLDQPMVYLCLTGITASPFSADVAHLLEWVQHHVLLGVQHIFLSVRFAWDSQNMHSLLLALRHFIEQKLVSVSSQAGDGFDRTASTKGLSW
jgi:hypothetical protein